MTALHVASVMSCWCVSCRWLDLSHNELSGSIPSTLGNLAFLQ